MITNSAALNARKAKAYRFQSIFAGSRRPSSRQRNIGNGVEAPARPIFGADRASGTSTSRSGTTSAIGRPNAQNGCKPREVGFHETNSSSQREVRTDQKRSGRSMA